MAAPSIKSGTGITVLESCDTGGTTPVAPSSPLSGSTPVACTQNNGDFGTGIDGTGNAEYYTAADAQGNALQGGIYALGSAEDFSGADVLLGVHLSISSAGGQTDDLSATTGIFLYANSASTGSEERSWPVAGDDQLLTGYQPVIVNVTRTSDAHLNDANFDAADVTHIGVVFHPNGTYKGFDHDSYVKIETIVLINGETGNKGDFTDYIAHIDGVDAILYEQPTQNFTFAFFPWVVGDGTTETHFEENQKVWEFPGQPDFTRPFGRAHVNDNDLGFGVNASANDVITFSGCQWRSDSPFFWEIEGSSSATVTISGSTIIGAGSVIVDDGMAITQCIFDSCGEMQSSQPTLTSCTFDNATDAALTLDTSDGLANTGGGNTFQDGVVGIEVTVTGNCTLDVTEETFSGNTHDIRYTGTGTLTVTKLASQSLTSTVTGGGTVTFTAPTTTFTVDPDIAACDIYVYTAGSQTVLASGTGINDLDYVWTTSGSVDIQVFKAGYIPYRQTGITLIDGTVNVTMTEDPVYQSGHGLAYTTDWTYNATTKVLTLVTEQEARDFYSSFQDVWKSEAASNTNGLRNKPFLWQANGPDGIIFTQGAECTSDANLETYWKGAGVEYQNASGTVTAQWASFKSNGSNTSGNTAEYQQQDGAGTTDASASGNVDEVVQIYGDSTHGNFDYRGHMVWKFQINGYREARVDVVNDLNSGDNLEPLEYRMALSLVAIAASTGDPAITVLTITDHGASPVSWNSKNFGITITDGGTTSGEDILRELNYNLSLDATYESKDPFNWPEMVIEAGSAYETARGYTEGAQSSTFKGVRVLRGGNPHPDFTRFQSDDGTYFTPTVTANIAFSGMPTDGADIRLQIWNETAKSASAWAATTAYSVGDKVLRSTGLGTENTAGLYMVCTTAGTSAGTEPTWDTTVGNTTADGTVTWTTFAILYHDADPASASYADTYTDGEEFSSGDTVGYRFAELNGSSTFKIDSGTVLAATAGFTVAISVIADSVYATNAVDGSAVTQFTADFNNDEIDLSADSDFTAAQAYAFYCYTLTTSNGMWNFWGGVVATSGSYEVQTATLNLKFDNTTTGSVKQTDSARIYRDDGVYPVKDPSTSGYGVQVNWASQVFAINTGGSGLTAGESAQLAEISQVKSKTDSLTFTQAGNVDANVQYVNDQIISGDGSEGNRFSGA